MSISPHTLTFRRKTSLASPSGKNTSLSEYAPKDTINYSAVRSISKGVKHNDLSFITGSSLNKLRVEDTLASRTIEVDTIHQNLTAIRKKHDDIKKIRLAKEGLAAQLKQQLMAQKSDESQYLASKQSAIKKTSELEKSLGDKKAQYQNSLFEKKVREHMMSRTSNDNVFLTQRKYALGKQLLRTKKKLQILKGEERMQDQQSDRAQRLQEKLAKQILIEAQQRQQHLESLKQSIRELEDSRQSTLNRQQEIQTIAEKALQDRDDNQKKWRKLMMSHLFVERLLREKMEKEMQKFHVVELAFKNIKTATAISDTAQLVDKFLNKELVYGELLAKIAESEKIIDVLKHQRQALEMQNRRAQSEQQAIEEYKTENSDLTSQIKQKDLLDARAIKTRLQTNRLKDWLRRQLRKIGYSQQANVDKQDIKHMTTIFCDWILKQEINKPEKNYENPEDAELVYSPKDKLFRVKLSQQTETNELQQNQTNQQQEYWKQSREAVFQQNQPPKRKKEDKITIA